MRTSRSPTKALPRRGARRRGGAMVELALVVPLLVTMFFFSMYLTELVRAKLKLHEASRFASWEMTSYVLTDFGGTQANRHDRAFNEARDKTIEEVEERYKDLDSVDEANAGNLFVGYSNVAVKLENLEVPGFDAPLGLSGSGEGGGLGSAVLGAAGNTTDRVLRQFEFNTKGQVRAEASMTLDNKLLSKQFLDGSGGLFTVNQWGGAALESVNLRARHTLVATGWHLPDGSDAIMSRRAGRAGTHRWEGERDEHGLYRQVSRMTGLGLSLPGLPPAVTNVLGMLGPAVLPTQGHYPTFVVSHNYGLEPRNDTLRDCVARGQGDNGHHARDGLNNLRKANTLDYERRSCYDTAPFRDASGYEDASQYPSLYAGMFKARGPYFMGCQQPQADNPSVKGAPSSTGDKNKKKVNCEL